MKNLTEEGLSQKLDEVLALFNGDDGLTGSVVAEGNAKRVVNSETVEKVTNWLLENDEAPHFEMGKAIEQQLKKQQEYNYQLRVVARASTAAREFHEALKGKIDSYNINESASLTIPKASQTDSELLETIVLRLKAYPNVQDKFCTTICPQLLNNYPDMATAILLNPELLFSLCDGQDQTRRVFPLLEKFFQSTEASNAEFLAKLAQDLLVAFDKQGEKIAKIVSVLEGKEGHIFGQFPRLRNQNQKDLLAKSLLFCNKLKQNILAMEFKSFPWKVRMLDSSETNFKQLAEKIMGEIKDPPVILLVGTKGSKDREIVCFAAANNIDKPNITITLSVEEVAALNKRSGRIFFGNNETIVNTLLDRIKTANSGYFEAWDARVKTEIIPSLSNPVLLDGKFTDFLKKLNGEHALASPAHFKKACALLAQADLSATQIDEMTIAFSKGLKSLSREKNTRASFLGGRHSSLTDNSVSLSVNNNDVEDELTEWSEDILKNIASLLLKSPVPENESLWAFFTSNNPFTMDMRYSSANRLQLINNLLDELQSREVDPSILRRTMEFVANQLIEISKDKDFTVDSETDTKISTILSTKLTARASSPFLSSVSVLGRDSEEDSRSSLVTADTMPLLSTDWQQKSFEKLLKIRLALFPAKAAEYLKDYVDGKDAGFKIWMKESNKIPVNDKMMVWKKVVLGSTENQGIIDILLQTTLPGHEYVWTYISESHTGIDSNVFISNLVAEAKAKTVSAEIVVQIMKLMMSWKIVPLEQVIELFKLVPVQQQNTTNDLLKTPPRNNSRPSTLSQRSSNASTRLSVLSDTPSPLQNDALFNSFYEDVFVQSLRNNLASEQFMNAMLTIENNDVVISLVKAYPAGAEVAFKLWVTNISNDDSLREKRIAHLIKVLEEIAPQEKKYILQAIADLKATAFRQTLLEALTKIEDKETLRAIVAKFPVVVSHTNTGVSFNETWPEGFIIKHQQSFGLFLARVCQQEICQLEDIISLFMEQKELAQYKETIAIFLKTILIAEPDINITRDFTFEATSAEKYRLLQELLLVNKFDSNNSTTNEWLVKMILSLEEQEVILFSNAINTLEQDRVKEGRWSPSIQDELKKQIVNSSGNLLDRFASLLDDVGALKQECAVARVRTATDDMNVRQLASDISIPYLMKMFEDASISSNKIRYATILLARKEFYKDATDSQLDAILDSFLSSGVDSENWLSAIGLADPQSAYFRLLNICVTSDNVNKINNYLKQIPVEFYTEQKVAKTILDRLMVEQKIAVSAIITLFEKNSSWVKSVIQCLVEENFEAMVKAFVEDVASHSIFSEVIFSDASKRNKVCLAILDKARRLNDSNNVERAKALLSRISAEDCIALMKTTVSEEKNALDEYRRSDLLIKEKLNESIASQFVDFKNTAIDANSFLHHYLIFVLADYNEKEFSEACLSTCFDVVGIEAQKVIFKEIQENIKRREKKPQQKDHETLVEVLQKEIAALKNKQRLIREKQLRYLGEALSAEEVSDAIFEQSIQWILDDQHDLLDLVSTREDRADKQIGLDFIRNFVGCFNNEALREKRLAVLINKIDSNVAQVCKIFSMSGDIVGQWYLQARKLAKAEQSDALLGFALAHRDATVKTNFLKTILKDNAIATKLLQDHTVLRVLAELAKDADAIGAIFAALDFQSQCTILKNVSIVQNIDSDGETGNYKNLIRLLATNAEGSADILLSYLTQTEASAVKMTQQYGRVLVKTAVSEAQGITHLLDAINDNALNQTTKEHLAVIILSDESVLEKISTEDAAIKSTIISLGLTKDWLAPHVIINKSQSLLEDQVNIISGNPGLYQNTYGTVDSWFEQFEKARNDGLSDKQQFIAKIRLAVAIDRSIANLPRNQPCKDFVRSIRRSGSDNNDAVTVSPMHAKPEAQTQFEQQARKTFQWIKEGLSNLTADSGELTDLPQDVQFYVLKLLNEEIARSRKAPELETLVKALVKGLVYTLANVEISPNTASNWENFQKNLDISQTKYAAISELISLLHAQNTLLKNIPPNSLPWIIDYLLEQKYDQKEVSKQQWVLQALLEHYPQTQELVLNALSKQIKALEKIKPQDPDNVQAILSWNQFYRASVGLACCTPFDTLRTKGTVTTSQVLAELTNFERKIDQLDSEPKWKETANPFVTSNALVESMARSMVMAVTHAIYVCEDDTEVESLWNTLIAVIDNLEKKAPGAIAGCMEGLQSFVSLINEHKVVVAFQLLPADNVDKIVSYCLQQAPLNELLLARLMQAYPSKKMEILHALDKKIIELKQQKEQTLANDWQEKCYDKLMELAFSPCEELDVHLAAFESLQVYAKDQNPAIKNWTQQAVKAIFVLLQKQQPSKKEAKALWDKFCSFIDTLEDNTLAVEGLTQELNELAKKALFGNKQTQELLRNLLDSDSGLVSRDWLTKYLITQHTEDVSDIMSFLIRYRLKSAASWDEPGSDEHNRVTQYLSSAERRLTGLYEVLDAKETLNKNTPEAAFALQHILSDLEVFERRKAAGAVTAIYEKLLLPEINAEYILEKNKTNIEACFEFIIQYLEANGTFEGANQEVAFQRLFQQYAEKILQTLAWQEALNEENEHILQTKVAQKSQLLEAQNTDCTADVTGSIESLNAELLEMAKTNQNNKHQLEATKILLWNRYSVLLEKVRKHVGIETHKIIEGLKPCQVHGKPTQDPRLNLLYEALNGVNVYRRIPFHTVVNFSNVKANYPTWFQDAGIIPVDNRLIADAQRFDRQDVLQVVYLSGEKKWMIVGYCPPAETGEPVIFHCSLQNPLTVKFFSNDKRKGSDQILSEKWEDVVGVNMAEKLRELSVAIEKNVAKKNLDATDDEGIKTCYEAIKICITQYFPSECEQYREQSKQLVQSLIYTAENCEEGDFKEGVIAEIQRRNLACRYTGIGKEVVAGIVRKPGGTSVSNIREEWVALRNWMIKPEAVAIMAINANNPEKLTLGDCLASLQARELALIGFSSDVADHVTKRHDREIQQLKGAFLRPAMEQAAFDEQYNTATKVLCIVPPSANFFKIGGDPRFYYTQITLDEKKLQQLERCETAEGLSGILGGESFYGVVPENAIVLSPKEDAPHEYGVDLIEGNMLKAQVSVTLTDTAIQADLAAMTHHEICVREMYTERNVENAKKVSQIHRLVQIARLEKERDIAKRTKERAAMHSVNATTNAILTQLKQNIDELACSSRNMSTKEAQEAKATVDNARKVISGYVLEGIQSNSSFSYWSEGLAQSFIGGDLAQSRSMLNMLGLLPPRQHLVAKAQNSEVLAVNSSIYIYQGKNLVKVASIQEKLGASAAYSLTWTSESMQIKAQLSGKELALAKVEDTLSQIKTLMAAREKESKQPSYINDPRYGDLLGAWSSYSEQKKNLEIDIAETKNALITSKEKEAKRFTQLASDTVDCTEGTVLRDAKGNPLGYMNASCQLVVDEVFDRDTCKDVLLMQPLKTLSNASKSDVDILIFDVINRGLLPEFYRDVFQDEANQQLSTKDIHIAGLNDKTEAVKNKKTFLEERFIQLICSRKLVLNREDCKTLAEYHSIEVLLNILSHSAAETRKILLMQMLLVASHASYFSESSHIAALFVELKANHLTAVDVQYLLTQLNEKTHPYAAILKQVVRVAYLSSVEELHINDLPVDVLRLLPVDVRKAALQLPQNLVNISPERFKILAEGLNENERATLFTNFINNHFLNNSPYAEDGLIAFLRGLGEKEFWTILNTLLPKNDASTKDKRKEFFNAFFSRPKIRQVFAEDLGDNNLLKLIKHDIAEKVDDMENLFWGATKHETRYTYFTLEEISQLVPFYKGEYSKSLELFLSDWIMIHMSRLTLPVGQGVPASEMLFKMVTAEPVAAQAQVFHSDPPIAEVHISNGAPLLSTSSTIVPTADPIDNALVLDTINPEKTDAAILSFTVNNEGQLEKQNYTVTSYNVEELVDPFARVAKLIGDDNFRKALVTKYPFCQSAVEKILKATARDFAALYDDIPTQRKRRFSYEAASFEFPLSLSGKFEEGHLLRISAIDYCLLKNPPPTIKSVTRLGEDKCIPLREELDKKENTEKYQASKASYLAYWDHWDEWEDVLDDYVGSLYECKVDAQKLSRLGKIRETLTMLFDKGGDHADHAFHVLMEKRNLLLLMNIYNQYEHQKSAEAQRIRAEVKEILRGLFVLAPIEVFAYLSEFGRGTERINLIKILELESILGTTTDETLDAQQKSRRTGRTLANAATIGMFASLGAGLGYFSSKVGVVRGAVVGTLAGLAVATFHRVTAWVYETGENLGHAVKDTLRASTFGISKEDLNELKHNYQDYRFEESHRGAWGNRYARMNYYYKSSWTITKLWYTAWSYTGLASVPESTHNVRSRDTQLAHNVYITTRFEAKEDGTYEVAVGNEKNNKVATVGDNGIVFLRKQANNEDTVYYECIVIDKGVKKDDYKDIRITQQEFEEFTRSQTLPKLNGDTAESGIALSHGYHLEQKHTSQEAFIKLLDTVEKKHNAEIQDKDTRRRPNHYCIRTPAQLSVVQTSVVRGDDLSATIDYLQIPMGEKVTEGHVLALLDAVNMVHLSAGESGRMGHKGRYKIPTGLLSRLSAWWSGQTTLDADKQLEIMQKINDVVAKNLKNSDLSAVNNILRNIINGEALAANDNNVECNPSQQIKLKSLRQELQALPVWMNQLQHYVTANKTIPTDVMDMLQHKLLGLLKISAQLITLKMTNSPEQTEVYAQLRTINDYISGLSASSKIRKQLEGLKTILLFESTHASECLLIDRLQALKQTYQDTPVAMEATQTEKDIREKRIQAINEDMWKCYRTILEDYPQDTKTRELYNSLSSVLKAPTAVSRLACEGMQKEAANDPNVSRVRSPSTTAPSVAFHSQKPKVVNGNDATLIDVNGDKVIPLTYNTSMV